MRSGSQFVLQFSSRSLPLLAWLIIIGSTGSAFAQVGNVGGVSIDAQGLLRETRTLSPNDRLKLIQQEAIAGPQSQQISQASALRKISLKRLEQTIQKLHETGVSLPADVEHLAGLTGIRYILFDPAAGDVILAGPAEGWTQLPTGEVVGQTSQRPVLHGEDLVAALRYAFDEQNTDAFIGCSIDPTPEGTARYAAYMKRLGRIDRSRVKQIFAGMEQAMGPQAVRLFGVEPSSRFALVMLAADYRLKRIALGHDPSPVKEVTCYLDLAAKRYRAGPQKQHRWWFQARYNAIHETPDHLAFELVGDGLEVVTSPGLPGQQQADKQMASPEAEAFAESFTKHFSAIAGTQPVFAELQNLIALATAAELIAEKQRSDAGDAHWRPEHFLDSKACPVRKYAVPKQVPSLANYRLIRNRHWLISISGGVEISPRDLIRAEHRQAKPHRPLDQFRQDALPAEENSRWWWDE